MPNTDDSPRFPLVIDRNKWSRGIVYNQLLCKDGKKCAMGWFLSAVGVPETSFLNEVSPAHFSGALEALPTESFSRWVTELTNTTYAPPGSVPSPRVTDKCHKIMKVNDAVQTHGPGTPMFERMREMYLAELFSSVGVDVSFVGEE